MTNKAMASVGRWGAALIPAFIVGASAITKLIDIEGWQDRFVGWGYPGWMAQVIGVVELVAVVLLIWPKYRFYGGVALVGIMIGAAITHAVHGEYFVIVVNLVVSILAGFSAWWFRPKWVRDKLAKA